MKQRKLSAGQSRAELIASYSDGETTMLATPPPPPAKAPPKPTPPKAEVEQPDESDAAVAKAIDAAIAAQEKDPDKDADDEKVLDLLQQAKAAQAKDDTDEKPLTAATSQDESQMCANSGCGHLASAHADGTGACSMDGCSCPAMALDGEGEALAIVPGAPGAAATDPVADTDQNPPPAVDGGENLGPAFSGVLVIEGQPTGDGREIAAEALSWREPPLPLMLLATETHDPEGFDMNDPAVMAGRIDTLTREPGEGETQLIRLSGNFLATDDGMHAAELTEQMGRMGISADIAVQDREITITEADEYGFPIDGTETLTEGTIMGGTACPFPAFQGCYIVLGDGSDLPDAKAIPQAAEQPETPDKPPAVVANGGQLVHWMSYEECEACDQGIETIVASGAGPTRPPKGWFEDPQFTEGDGRLVEILGRNGQREDKYACPITVTEDGRVFGHIAPWGICHKGIGASCVLAPKSAVGYAHFLTAKHLLTAEGENVRVGVLTADTGHASTSMSLSPQAAIAHYDNTGLAVADVAVGEDDYGIWVAGAVRSDASEQQIHKLRASAISGDWRNIGGQLELVAALCVNEPGFPLAVVAHGQQEALVAYGAQVMDKLKHHAERDPADLLSIAAPALGRLARRDARERVAELAT